MSSKTPQSNFSTLSRGNNNNKRVYPDQDSLLTTKNPHLLHLSPQPPNLLSAANLLSTGELFAGTTSKNFVLSTADLSRALNNTGADAVATNLPNRLPKTRTSQGNNNQGSSAHRTQTTGTRPSTGLVGRASLIGQMVTSPNQLPRVGAAGGNSSGIASPGGMASPMNDSNNNLAIHIPAIIPPSSSSIANRPAQWTKSNSKHVGKSANAASASAAVATGEGGLGGASGSSGSQRLHETPPASGQTPSYSVGMPPSSSSMSASGAKIFQDDEISIGSKKLSRRHPSKTSSLRAGASQHVFSDEDLRNNTNMNSGGGGGVSSRYVFGDQSQSSFGMNGVGSSGFIPPALLPFSSHSLPLNNSAAAPINSAALVNSLLKAGLASKNGGEGGGENGSVYSRTLQDRLHQYGNALRGPIIVEMFLHYSYFLIVLLAAFITNWAPQIHFYMGFFYYVVSILTLTLSRLIFTRKVNSVLPFYISLPAFGILIFVSREAHMIVMVLWFLSILIIFVQTGNKSLHKHLCFFVALFVATYILAIWVMNITYKTDCSGVTCGGEFFIAPSLFFFCYLSLISLPL